MQKGWFLVTVLCIIFQANAQQFGGNPFSRKWKQIHTDTVRVIFPKGLDSQANRVASVVHYLAANQPLSLGDQLKKIDIVLQNQTTISNGYVQLGPFRSEFYLTPFPNNFDQGTIPWSDQLSLHEYRHVQQYNNFNNGLSRLMKTLFGQDGYDLAVNAAIPDWFYEGEAVHSETVLTGQGRGRLPQFLNAYPALWQARKKYSWMKLRNGSFKDYVPTHYHLGYLLVNHGYEKYGADFWKKVTADASAYKNLFYPFQAAVRKHSGVTYKTFREEALSAWREKPGRATRAGEEFLQPVNRRYVSSYYFPYRLAPDSLLYLKATYRHRPAFYIRDPTGEKRLRIRDISIDEQYSYRNGRIVYAAYETDPRWSWRNYSVIRILDTRTGKPKKLTRRSRYFTPDISADGSRVVAVEFAEEGRSELHVLDAATGAVLQRVGSPDVHLFTDPKFLDENRIVTAVRLRTGEMSLILADTRTRELTRLTPASFNVVGYPCVYNNQIYFTATYGGNEDVFVLRLHDKKIFRVSDGPLGNYYVNAAHGRITWSAFTAEGLQLVEMNESDISRIAVDSTAITALEEKLAVGLSKQTGNVLLRDIRQRSFPVQDYRKSTRLVNFHSWRPYYEDPVYTFSVYGENILNTLQSEIYYLYNDNEKTSAVGVSAVYGALFPYLSFGTEYTFNRERLVGNRLRQWSQLDSRIGMTVPLNFISGRTISSFSFSNSYVHRNEFNKGFFKDSIGNTSFGYLSHSLGWMQQVQRAVQHLFPRTGYALNAGYRYPVSRYEGYQSYAGVTVYLPGVSGDHHLVLTGAIQQRDTSRLIFSTRLANARGYADYYNTNAGSRMWRISANYHLPLLYPDWGFGNMLYFQRIRANLFYDLQRVFSNDKKLDRDFRSAGVELYADTKWWNQYSLTFGLRISRLLDDDPLGLNGKGSVLYEIILPVSIFPR